MAPFLPIQESRNGVGSRFRVSDRKDTKYYRDGGRIRGRAVPAKSAPGGGIKSGRVWRGMGSVILIGKSDSSACSTISVCSSEWPFRLASGKGAFGWIWPAGIMESIKQTVIARQRILNQGPQHKEKFSTVSYMIQPIFEKGDSMRIQVIKYLASVFAGLYKSHLAQRSEMVGDGRFRQAYSFGQSADVIFSRDKHGQDPDAACVAERSE
jgi:hypothetical protein